LIVVAAATFVFAATSKSAAAARVIFGFSSICFGLGQIMNIPANLMYVPLWMPFGRAFWVIFTGVAFVLAGVAILSGILDVLASRLLSIQWLVISAVTLIPGLIAEPHNQANWGGNAYNLLAAASAWILASWLATRNESARVKHRMRTSTA
jgi:cell shape-determining protein MreD